MEFRVLGPVEVWQGGRPLELGPPKQVALVAKLLQHANQVVSVSQLIEALWGEAAPDTAPTILHTYVHRLRRVLRPPGNGRTSEEVLCTKPPGYLLKVKKGQLDLDRFESLVAAATGATARGDHETASRLLRSALSLWRGEALANVTSEELRRTEAVRLEERRQAALEARVGAELSLGRHRDVIGDLTALTVEYPLRESLHAQLMVALYRSGRPADALTAYRRLRQTLIEELGAEPGSALQRLQRAILTADPSLGPPEPHTPAGEAQAALPTAREGGSAPQAAASAPAVRPRQLPPDTASFVGRERELSDLKCLLGRAAPGGSMVIVAIDGAAGVGKSALANHAAHRLAIHFPDGQLYVDLRGEAAGPAPLDPGEVLGRFLRALGPDGRHLPAEPEERAGLLRSLLADRRVLVVLDNAATASQVRLLLPASPTCVALITSRRQLAELDGAVHLHLDLLGADESLTLLARLAGPHRVEAEPTASAEVVRLCGRLPLALRIAGARLAARPAWSVSTLAERLRDERLRLDELELDGLAVRASLRMAYRELRDHSPAGLDAARAFRLLALLDGADVGVPVAAALLDQPTQAASASLERLLDANLLESSAPTRYRFHDLVRLFARECAWCDDSEPDRVAALTRALRFYLTTARRADDLLRPGQWPASEVPLSAGVAFRDRAAALDWLETERANLLAAVRQAVAGPDHPVAWQLAAALFGFFDVRGSWDEWEQVNRLALQAAQGRGDQRSEAQVWRDLGAVSWRRFRLDEAADHLERSLELRRLIGDRHGEAQSLNSLGLVLTARRCYQDAAAYLQRSQALFHECGDRRGEGQVLNNLGDLYRMQGRYDEALVCLLGDLEICCELGDRRGEAITLCNLGEVHRDRCRADEAFDCHHHSRLICQELGDRRGQGLNLDGLGEARRLQGRHWEAIDFLRQGVALLREARDRHGEADALWHLGLALDAVGDQREATSCLQLARTLFEELHAPEAAEVRDLERLRQPVTGSTERRP
jgi:DNA-binding SARP family transcriptional activator/tetratricopeptide (TPR) repeat protein